MKTILKRVVIRSAIGYVASTPGVLYWAENSTIKDGWPGPFVRPPCQEQFFGGYSGGNFIKFEFPRDLSGLAARIGELDREMDSRRWGKIGSRGEIFILLIVVGIINKNGE